MTKTDQTHDKKLKGKQQPKTFPNPLIQPYYVPLKQAAENCITGKVLDYKNGPKKK